MKWRLWLGGAAILAIVLLLVGKGFRLPMLGGGGRMIVIVLVGLMALAVLLRRRDRK